MNIRGLDPRNFAELADAVPIGVVDDCSISWSYSLLLDISEELCTIGVKLRCLLSPAYSRRPCVDQYLKYYICYVKFQAREVICNIYNFKASL